MPRIAGASGKGVFRIKFTDTDNGHNWYAGPYASGPATRALRTRKVKEMNAEREGTGKNPIKGVVEVARNIRWVEEEGDADG